MKTYYLWDMEGNMYAIDGDDQKAFQAGLLRLNSKSHFWYGSIKMVRCIGVV
jgi:hypothetical protein